MSSISNGLSHKLLVQYFLLSVDTQQAFLYLYIKNDIHVNVWEMYYLWDADTL